MIVNTYDTANEAFAAFCQHVIARNPKGATMTTESPAEQVARLAAETEGAFAYAHCSQCERIWEGLPECCHDDGFITAPLYFFPPAKPAPPTSRETLAANVLRLRVAKGWSVDELIGQLPPCYGHATYWIKCVEVGAINGDADTDPDDLDALAKALDTTPAALLTPETEK